MKEKKDYSYGVIPVRRNGAGELEFLLIYQYSQVKGDHYWVFPKGHPEEGETPVQSAQRELKEETGLEAAIDETQTFSMFYEFTVGDTLVKKEAIFFVGDVIGGELVLQPEEVAEARWCDFMTAQATLNHDITRDLLTRVQQHLTAHPK